MKSPFTGGDVKLMQEMREIVFRNEKFEYLAHYYVCADTGEKFTTTQLDELDTAQIHDQYQAKFGVTSEPR